MIPKADIEAAEQFCREIDNQPIQPTADNPLGPLIAQVNELTRASKEADDAIQKTVIDGMREAFNNGFYFGRLDGLREATRLMRAGGTTAECAINDKLRQMERQFQGQEGK